MSRIFIINDLSPSQPWLHWALAANAEALAKSGIELAPFNPWSAENIPHHCHLWMPQPKGASAPAWIGGQWERMARILESGRSLLIMAQTPWLEAHEYFYSAVAHSLPGHAAQYLGIIGSPFLALEQRHRECAAPLDEASADFYARCYLNCKALPAAAAKFLGGGNVRVIANTDQNATSVPAPPILEEASAFLDCPALEAPASLPLDALFFKSHDARILTRAKSVRFNSWPAIDEGAYARILADLDSQWGEDVATPAALRENMAKILKNMGAGPISCPSLPSTCQREFLAEQSATPVATPLDPKRAWMFAQALPLDMRQVLRQRFDHDRYLLSINQKIFNSTLSLPLADSFSSIGEPAHPVEVAVLTMAYNHESYIGQCIEGVLGQQTEFPVRHIILDHSSTDGTAAIVAEYARKNPSIQPVLLSRRVHPENVAGLFMRCHAKYAALCDGDDYFTDPLKLARQVEFLENNTDHAISFHPVSVEYEDGSPGFIYPPRNMLPRGGRGPFYLSHLFQGNFIQTNSAMYRWRFRDGLPDWFRADICPGDWYWHLLHAETGKIGMLPQVMSVYRRHGGSTYNNSFVSALGHRRSHGLAELETYKAVYGHFGESYFISLAKLANGVFASFMEIYMKEGDSSLLDAGCEHFPRFGKYFLSSLQFVGANNNHGKNARIV